jgi:hypothetical protein
MFARAITQTLNLIKSHHNQIRESRQVKRVEWLVAGDQSKIAQTESFEFKFSPFVSGR